MKNFTIKLAGLLLIAALPLMAYNPVPLDAFSSGGTAVGTTLSYAVVSAYSVNNGTPVVNYVNAQSEKAASVVQFYSPTTNAVATFNNTTTSLPVNYTNGFASGDIIVIRHMGTDTYERRILTTFTGATNLTLTVAPTATVTTNDLIYRMATDGAIAWGAATNSIGPAGALYSGLPGKPVLVEIDFTAAGSLNCVNASYYRIPVP